MLFQHIGCIDRSDLIGVLHTLLWWGQGVVPISRCMVENWLVPPIEGCWSEQGARTGAAGPCYSGKTYIAMAMKVASSGEHGAGRGKGSDGCNCLGHIVSRELGRMWSAYLQAGNAVALPLYVLKQMNVGVLFANGKRFCTVTGYRNSSQAQNVLWDICLFYAGL